MLVTLLLKGIIKTNDSFERDDKIDDVFEGFLYLYFFSKKVT